DDRLRGPEAYDDRLGRDHRYGDGSGNRSDPVGGCGREGVCRGGGRRDALAAVHGYGADTVVDAGGAGARGGPGQDRRPALGDASLRGREANDLGTGDRYGDGSGNG